MNITKFPEHITEELAEETGWHISDGSMNYYRKDGKMQGFYQLRGHIEDDRPHYEQRISLLFKELYDIQVSLRVMPSTRVFGFQIWNNELINYKQKLGLPLGRKLTIEIPSLFLKEEKLKAAVIRGIFDTDGCVYLERKNGKLYPRTEISTISFPLANQLSSVLRSLNLRTTLHTIDPRGNRLLCYRLVTRGDEMFHRFMTVIQPANLKHQEKYLAYKKGLK